MFWHCEIEFRTAKLALRNFRIANWVLRKFSHCEIAFGIAKFRIAKFSHCEIKIGIAKSILALRNAQWPAATVPLVLHPAASHPVSTASHFLHFSFDFPLILGLVDG